MILRRTRCRTLLIFASACALLATACSNVAVTTNPGSVANDTIAPSVPQDLTVQAVTVGELSLSWLPSSDSGGAGVAGYRIFRDGVLITGPFAFTLTTLIDSGLQAGATYTYTVVAVDGANNESAQSVPVSGHTMTGGADNTAPTVPTGLTVQATMAGVLALAWQPSTDSGGAGLAGYRVARDGITISGASAITGTSYVDSGLGANTTYTYTVSALDNAGNMSAASTPVSQTTLTVSAPDTTPPTAPASLRATTVTTTQISLAWNASSDAGGSGVAGYRVFRGGTLVSGSGLIAATSYTDTGRAAGTSYTYVVRAVDGAGNVSTDSNSVVATTGANPDTTPPPAPAGLTGNATSATQVALSWNAVADIGSAGLAGYRVYRDGVLASGSTPIAAAIYSDSGLTAATLYQYFVRAVDNAGNASGDSNIVSVTTPANPDSIAPPAPTGLSGNATSATQISLAWSSVTDTGGSGLAGYRVYRNGVLISGSGFVIAASYVDNGLTASTAYTYVVRAVDNAGNASADSNSVTVTTTTAPDTTAPSAPANLSGSATGTTQITLSWSASTDSGGSGLAGYRVYRGGALVSGTSLVTSTSFVNTGLTAATAYSYVVRAVDGAGNVSGDSNTVTIATPAADTTPPSAPTALVGAADSTTQISLRWNVATDSGGSGLAGYRVYRGGTLISGSSLVTSASYVDSGLTTGTAYSYFVRAVDGAGNISGNSNTVSETTLNPPDTIAPSTPIGLGATALNSSQISLTWTASTDTGGSGLAGYFIYRGGVQIAGSGLVTSTNFVDLGLTAATAYTYSVRAVDGAGNTSGSSNSVTVSTASGAGLGLDSRPSNTSCLAPNEPVSGGGIVAQKAYPNRRFSFPLGAMMAPGDSSKWYIVEQTGTISMFDAADTNGSAISTFLNLGSKVAYQAESGLLGMAFHPNYASNGFVYVYYTAPSSPVRTVIARFTRSGSVLDPASEQILLTIERHNDHHVGGNIAFGPDGYLYIGSGDGNEPLSSASPQNRHTLFGKLLRIDVNNTTQGANYAIPSGNPYAAGAPALCRAGVSSGANCPEIYAYGLRNPWKWSFDRAASQPDLWLGDVGASTYEEVDRIVAGGNYGWPIREGLHDAGNGLSNNSGDPIVDPVHEYSHAVGNAIVGGYVYRGSLLPSLAGRYVFADFVVGDVYFLTSNPSGQFGIYDLNLLTHTSSFISSFGQDNGGELYYTSQSDGQLYKIVPGGGGGGGSPVPTNLADTGCFSNLATQAPASGLIPYTVNAPFWSDGAAKVRYMALPNGATVTVGSDGDWSFPAGSVLVKNFYLAGRIVETRLLMRYRDTGNWAGFTYQWNAAQDAATLVTGGLSTQINGQTYTYPSSAQCLECHTSTAGFTLGLETAQLNGSLTYPSTGRTANQLNTLSAISVFSNALPDASTLPALPDPVGAADVASRARAYLHTNCSFCHRPNSPTPVTMDLRYTTAIGATTTCGITPTISDLGIANAKRIAPGSAATSVLFQRANRRGADQMPPLVSNVIDTAGTALLSQWINGMNASCN